MTREEAIERLKIDIYKYADFTENSNENEFWMAFDMAIKALEQQPKFIAKSDGTIEHIKNCNDCLFKKEWEKIGKFISVVLEKQTEQEPKTGHWITKPHVYGVTYCSECDFELKIDNTNYCPNCGARLVEPQTESEETDADSD